MNSKIRNICIFLSILLIVGIAGCVFFWMIIRENIDKAYANEVAAKQAELNAQQEKSLESLINNVGPDIDTIKTRIIDKNGTVPFIDSIEALAKSAGATVLVEAADVAPLPNAQDANAFEYLTLRVSTQGSWKSVYRLLSVIESLPYKLVITKVTLDENLLSQPGSASSTSSSVNRTWKGTFELSVLKRK